MLLWAQKAAEYLLTGGEVNAAAIHIVTVYTSPPMEFYKQDAAIPYLSGLHCRRLLTFDPFRRPVGGSIGGSENSNGGVVLDNSDGYLSRLWMIPPLRARVTHDIITNGVRRNLFSGSVAQITITTAGVAVALEA